MSQKFTQILGIIALTGLGTIAEAQINWAPAGPVYNAGRARNMIVDNTDPSKKTMYVGSASSGIFKTTDAGSNWAPINDQGSVRNISYMAQSKDGIIYVATGEGFLRWGQKAKAEPGTGLYKLTGSPLNTLTQIVSSSVVGTVINRVACDPSNASHIALATNTGIWVSIDQGASFTKPTGQLTHSLASGMDVKFDANGILYCSIGSELAYLGYNAVSSKVYKSTDNNLTTLDDKTPTAAVLANSNYGRIELAIAPTDNNVIYASCANKSTTNPNPTIPDPSAAGSASLKAIFVSYDGGSNWGLLLQGSVQIDPLSNGGSLASGDYAHVLVVSPSDKNTLFIGGYSFYIFQRTGGTNSSPQGSWAELGSPFAINTPYYLHENIHDIKVVPGTPTRFYFVTDAGIYRSSNITSFDQQIAPSFQPFYKGLATGQFNSVSIERYPINTGIPTAAGASVTPYIGFIGGTGGNGMTYFSGTYSLVTQETRYLTGEIYNTEYSKILSDAAFLATGTGNIYRTANAKNSNPAQVQINSYSGILSKIAPTPNTIVNPGFSSGTPFRLWENYGQRSVPPDSIAFYNDSLRFQASVPSVAVLTTQATFTWSAPRPNRFALIDSIVIRTGTVVLPITGSQANAPAFTGADKQDITIKLNNNYTVSGSVTAVTGTNISYTGMVSTTKGPTVTLNASTLDDEISVTFSSAPFVTKTTVSLSSVPNPADYYRVYATIFYKYKVGDSVHVTDNNISTKGTVYSAVLTKSINWAYGSLPSYNISAPNNPAIPNPTFVLSPGNNSQSTSTFVVRPIGVATYTIMQYGTYTLTAPTVVYTITAPTDTAVPSPTYVLNPGNVTQSTPAFTVIPTSLTNYTITETFSGTPTYSTIGTTTYALYPDSLYQSSPVFLVSPTANKTYTVAGISSNTLAAANTSTTYATTVAKTVTTTGSPDPPQAKNNTLVKIPMHLSARLAMSLNNNGNTGNQNAVVVAKNPLSLNDPLNLVRISQSGCLKDDANGIPTTNTISIPGKATVLEWSKSGTELYYATSDNKLYRVSHITTIMDQSASNYSGKFYTDIFMYNNVPTHGVNSSSINPNSPYRTTLIGDFGTNQVSSISVSNDDQKLAVTFNSAASGTAVVYNTASAKISDISNIGWVNKSSGIPATISTYCSLMEKGDNKKVFIGTNNGIYYTSDITSGTAAWVNVNTLAASTSQLPNVQVFDIEQQTMGPSDCYNSGQIYVATNGRGIWVTGTYLKPYLVSVNELDPEKVDNNLSIYPNPANGNVTVAFNGIDGENAVINIFDLQGRIVKTENLGKLNPGEVTYNFETSGLNSGIYIVNITATSGAKRIAKLIVTK